MHRSAWLLVLLVGCADEDDPKKAAAVDDSGVLEDGLDSSDTADTADTADSGEPEETDADGDGFTVEAGDCDDADPERHPDATEVCDGVDNDCDALIDDADDSIDPATQTEWHADADGDGFGAVEGVLACESPDPDAILDDSDCDDANPAVHPDAEEVCDDGIDNDCSSHIDDGCLPDGLEDAVVQVAGDGNGFGHSVAGGDVTGDGIDDLLVGAYIAGSGYEGSALVFAGPLSASVVASDAVGTISGTVAEGALGWQVDITEDVDGDGVQDMFIGAMGLGGSAARSPGTGYLITDSPVGGLSLPADAAATFTGAAQGANAGSFCLDVGDIDGDGVIDLAVGAQQAWDLWGATGQVYLMLGPVSGDHDLGTDADVTFYGATAAGGMGDWMSAGDLTGDGVSDLVLPSNTASTVGIVNGTVYIVSNPESGVVDVESDAYAQVDGTTYTGFGQVSAVADLTGDGYLDLVASDGTLPGAVYVMAGPLSGTSDVSTAHATFHGAGVAYFDNFGMALTTVDLDHDGADDLVIGAPHIETTMAGAGAVHVYLGNLSTGSHTVADADTSLDGTAPDALGIAVAAVGDTTGDGLEELAVTSQYRNEGAGQVWLFQ